MIQTHLLTLQPPYKYIYYGGIVGKQIATLVATVDMTDKDGNYELETHSHPVVVYNGHTAEGVVWNKCEVMDCRTVCSENDKRITLKQFNELLALTSFSTPNTANPNYLRSALRAAGIALEMPMDINYYGPDQPGTLKHFKVRLLFNISNDGYSAWSPFATSPLFFRVKAPNRKELIAEVLAQLYDWRMALEEFRVSVGFEAGTQDDLFDGCLDCDEGEVNGIIEELNKAAGFEQ